MDKARRAFRLELLSASVDGARLILFDAYLSGQKGAGRRSESYGYVLSLYKPRLTLNCRGKDRLTHRLDKPPTVREIVRRCSV